MDLYFLCRFGIIVDDAALCLFRYENRYENSRGMNNHERIRRIFPSCGVYSRRRSDRKRSIGARDSLYPSITAQDERNKSIDGRREARARAADAGRTVVLNK